MKKITIENCGACYRQDYCNLYCEDVIHPDCPLEDDTSSCGQENDTLQFAEWVAGLHYRFQGADLWGNDGKLIQTHELYEFFKNRNNEK